MAHNGAANTMSIKGTFRNFRKDDGERVGSSVGVIIGHSEQVKTKAGEGVAQESVHQP